MGITMKDIAVMANVNTSTVSRALNDSSSISAEVKEKILDIANAHNFKKRKVRSKEILYLIDKDFFLKTSNFYNQIIEGIQV